MMSNLSEEEIIEILKNQISDYVIGDYCVKCGHNKICNDRNEDCNFIQAIDGILDLYNKEKEKNKELENELKRIKSIDYCGLVEDFEAGLYMAKADVEEYYIPIENLKYYISKDKIREKIENLEISINDIKDNHIVDVIIYQDIKRLELKKEALEELLED